jgi:V/A-type H+-transporting ATPase subunit I
MLERERVAGLAALREVGVLHLETDMPSGEAYDALDRKRNLIAQAVNGLPKAKHPAGETLSAARAIELAERYDELSLKAKALLQELGNVQDTIERGKEWGNFDPKLLRELGEAGIRVGAYRVDAKRLSSLGEGVRFLRLGGKKGSVRIVVIGDASELGPEFVRYEIPERSLSELRDQQRAIRAELDLISKEYAEMARHAHSLQKAVAAIDQDIQFETARLSFASEGPVCFIRGFVPVEDEAAVKAAAARHGWALSIDDPAEEDAPPTKVVYHPIVRMIKPVFDFLGTVPGYREYEISPWFLLFFSIFFGMIFGDAGYGAILLLAGLGAAIKAKIGGKKVPDAIRLLLTLSVSTIGWGVLTASWFAIPPTLLPTFLIEISAPQISNAIMVDGVIVLNDMQTVMKNIQIVCFVIGVVQLTIAHLRNIARDFPSPKILAQIGSLAMIYGMYFFVLFLVVDKDLYKPPEYALYLVLGGFALNFVFGSWNGSLIKSFLAGLGNIIPNFLGMVGVFADIVSYLRLWAVGMAGAQLAQIINSLAGGTLQALSLAIVGGVLILGSGHVLNLVLSVLSVVVHGVRLNMLEFSSHLGMEWSGVKYDPFRVTHKE